MKVIVAGSREGVDMDMVWIHLDSHFDGIASSEIEIVSGTARGPDTFGAIWARHNGIRVKEFPADWETHGKAAGYIRNAQMADYANELLVFWDGQSRGTKNMIDEARKRKMKTTIVYV